MKLLNQILLLVFFPLVISVGISIFQIESLLERLDQTIQERLRDTSEQVKNDIDVFLKETRQFATLLAKTEEIVTGIEISDADILFQRGQLFSDIGIDYIAFADSQGKVVARGHDEFAFGDSLGDDPYFRKALDWKTLSLITPFDKGVFLISLVPAVLHEERIVGVVITGIALDRQFLGNIGKRHNVDISVRIGGKQVAGSFEGDPLPEWDTADFDYWSYESVIPGNEASCTVSIFEDNKARRSSLVRLRQNILFFTYALSFVIMGVVILLVMRMVAPVKILVSAMYEYSQGNRTLTELPVPKNEIGEISMAFSDLRSENVSLLNSLEEKVVQLREARDALWGEMELARKIQTCLLPTSVEEIHPDFEISAVMLTADEVGGDFYEITPDRSGNLWIAIGDVSGHGVTPGLIMMMAQTVHATVTTNLECEARNVVVKINEILYKNVHERLKETHFMTFNALKYMGRGKFEHAGAHLRIIVWRRESRQCELIRTKGVYLNFISDISKPTKNSYFELGEGDIMVLYTDGLTEAENPEGEMLDIDGFINIVEKHSHQEPEAMKENIIADVLRWCDDKRDDDMTLVIVKRKG
ncbi:SpoIIE family protein phosphatase [Desulfococcaceae bacterium HSG8]|nr:SpoIIE family protein phosphatase [Desulfococcaceae bacterium HSG8]